MRPVASPRPRLYTAGVSRSAGFVLAPSKEGGGMARGKLYLPAPLIAAAVLVACAVASLLAVSEEKAGAAFPGKNGRIAFQDSVSVVYTIDPINPAGGGKTEVAGGDHPSYSPDGRRIAYTCSDGHDAEICTISATGGKPSRLTRNARLDFGPSWSPGGKRIAYSGVSPTD